MKKIIGLILILIGLTTYSYASVYVKGYTKSNGTYVAPHYRSDPNGSLYDNYSYPGNTNPYTGKTASGNQDTYLNNYYNSSYIPSYGSSYVPSSYVPTYTSSVTNVYGGYTLSGVLYCNSGYYKKDSICNAQPENSIAYGQDNFYCNSGYVKNSYDTGCISKDTECKANHSLGAYYDNNEYKCKCSAGYFVNSNNKCEIKIVCSLSQLEQNNTCVDINIVCKNSFGMYAVALPDTVKDNNVSCNCQTGYEWATDRKSCVESKVVVYNNSVVQISPITINKAEQTFKMVGNENLRSCAKKSCKILKYGAYDGAKARIISKTKDWYYVEVDDFILKTKGYFNVVLIPQDLR